MKIVALTDIHGSYKRAVEIIKKEIPDVLIVGGDLTTVGTLKEAEHAIGEFRHLCSRVFCIAGNMDLPAHDDLFLKMGVSINGRGVRIGSVGFFGASAAPHSPLKTPHEVPEEEIMLRMRLGYRDVKDSPVRILVPHAPPYGTKLDIIHSGIHVGSTAVRDFIEEEEPEVVICGHIHEARGMDTLGNSRIVNCGAGMHGCYAIVEINEKIEITNCQLNF